MPTADRRRARLARLGAPRHGGRCSAARPRELLHRRPRPACGGRRPARGRARAGSAARRGRHRSLGASGSRAPASARTCLPRPRRGRARLPRRPHRHGLPARDVRGLPRRGRPRDRPGRVRHEGRARRDALRPRGRAARGAPRPRPARGPRRRRTRRWARPSRSRSCASGRAAPRARSSSSPGRPGDLIVTRRKGVASLRAEARGVAAHAGNEPEKGRSAIWALARFVDRAQALTDSGARPIRERRHLPRRHEQEHRAGPGRLRRGPPLRDRRRRARARGRARGGRPRRGAPRHDASRCRASRCARRSSGRPASAALAAEYGACQRESGLGAGEAPLAGGGSDACTTGEAGVPSIDGLGPRGARLPHAGRGGGPRLARAEGAGAPAGSSPAVRDEPAAVTARRGRCPSRRGSGRRPRRAPARRPRRSARP